MAEYAERDFESEEDHAIYLKHVSAMTVEGLHSKASIAAELAYRDIQLRERARQIETLTAQVANGLSKS